MNEKLDPRFLKEVGDLWLLYTFLSNLDHAIAYAIAIENSMVNQA